MDGRWVAVAGALAVLAAAGAGCFNGSFQDHSERGVGERLQLVVESDRTDVDATHFLLDKETGDLWRLEMRGASGSWVRLAAGPEDLADLEREGASGDAPQED